MDCIAAGDIVIVDVNPTATVGWYTFTPAAGVEICCCAVLTPPANSYVGLESAASAPALNYTNMNGTYPSGGQKLDMKVFCTNTFKLLVYGNNSSFCGMQIK